MIVHKLPSNIFGLSYIPSIEPELSDDLQIIDDTRSYNIFLEVSLKNRELLLTLLIENKNTIDLIVEIGVDSLDGSKDLQFINANGKIQDVESFTRTFINYKRDDAIYLGMDILDKSYLNDIKKNVFTLKTDSRNQEYNRKEISKFNKPIDVLLIDGGHSINAVVNDWRYADMLSVGGIVLFHDTNHHCGPKCVVDAIDTKIFDVKHFFKQEQRDWGMAYAFRKN